MRPEKLQTILCICLPVYLSAMKSLLTRKNAPPPGSYVFQSNGIIFELIRDIIRMNLLTNFMKIGQKNALPLGSHFFQANIIFELIQAIIETNLLINFMKIGQ
ncbi:hypothetical protein DPMN_059218 [Dreissena polymorpha]|uniref:Secreted protein n=1 Tax=Dreissena polymorpha TaxID=45954 RepID=A0A9D4HER2_DREPO|nr:hypothetical protein DPMN_059218 [Dreissena polymorpha]